ncbi:hypothetical protein L226DRAFT_576732 [Lentinus tigrinus ALCF2SS1-7]|uniref:Uncharacterized protein n=1 Tax=Lentinus tigrinus ALCF2SS1-6 TaxID=1328759 RepID=A0A5C2RM66_9APHY|nr:hypothetical protein L227DRAFT_617592 [Lentinus tigrinus ALCF2SS1-6]RPD57642.1 hypothetical protein L227DRAFT_613361 [Lentinus tigrinus ALCF2SS1-6]RPD68030.1 hypothetical protein L226DRAFT_576732 [Lentinus tigrinus ALCF2SS1-7]
MKRPSGSIEEFGHLTHVRRVDGVVQGSFKLRDSTGCLNSDKPSTSAHQSYTPLSSFVAAEPESVFDDDDQDSCFNQCTCPLDAHSPTLPLYNRTAAHLSFVDEAASALRLSQESNPDELEALDRQITA